MITSDLRSYFDAELHTRPFMQLGTNQRIFHFAMHCGETDPVRAWKYFNEVIKSSAPCTSTCACRTGACAGR